MTHIVYVEVEGKGRAAVDFQQPYPNVWRIDFADELLREGPMQLGDVIARAIIQLYVDTVKP